MEVGWKGRLNRKGRGFDSPTKLWKLFWSRARLGHDKWQPCVLSKYTRVTRINKVILIVSTYRSPWQQHWVAPSWSTQRSVWSLQTARASQLWTSNFWPELNTETTMNWWQTMMAAVYSDKNQILQDQFILLLCLKESKSLLSWNPP